MVRRIMGGLAGGKRRKIVRMALAHPKIGATTKVREILKASLDFPFVAELIEIINSLIEPKSHEFEKGFTQCTIRAVAADVKIPVTMVVGKNSVVLIFFDARIRGAEPTKVASISIDQTKVPGKIFNRKEKENYTISINIHRKKPAGKRQMESLLFAPEPDIRDAHLADVRKWFVNLTERLIFLAVSQGILSHAMAQEP